MKETIKNLAAAFVGESQARNRYTFYAKAAKKDGFEQISAIFDTTSEQERTHASILFKMINELKKDVEGGFDSISLDAAEVPTVFGSTAEHLKAAIAGETYEFKDMYPGFADVAEKEGLKDIAARLRAIALAEAHHADRYEKLLAEVQGGTVFKKDTEIEWTCRKCGYVHKGTEPPAKCPACNHDTGHFQRKTEEY